MYNLSGSAELSHLGIPPLALHAISKHQSDREHTRSILDLPPEIQCEIFIHAHRDSKNEASRLPMEVVLSHVCSKWRNIAINLPSLWIAFKFDSHCRGSWTDPTSKLEEYLCRSGTHLLELYFSISVSNYKEDPEDPDWELNYEFDLALVKIAIAHACRWRRFTLFADEFIPSFEVIDLLEEIYVPNLEYLALCLSDISLPENIDLLVFTGGAPKVYAVRVDAITPLHLPPPLSNITTLAIEGPDDDGAYFVFQKFYSILTIPTLTNLSIEACSCLDPLWIYEGKIFQMPSLKTLRISQDSNILGMLSSIDAPLLETLALQDVDLGEVWVDQDTYNIPTFIRLDTIVLLDCRYQFRRLGEEYANEVDMIFNTLVCHAAHIIISSHGGPSFIENRSNILDFSQYGWPRLQRITLDLSASSGPGSYIRILKRSPHLITVRVTEPLLDEWERFSSGLTRLEKVCKLETMKVGDLMMDEPWPTPEELFEEDGILENRFIWGEALRAKGPDWILEE